MGLELALPLATTAATFAVVWYTRANAKSSLRMEDKQSPKAILERDTVMKDGRRMLKVIIVNCAQHPIALMGVELQGAPHGILRRRPVLECHVTWPNQYTTEHRFGGAFSLEVPVRAIGSQAELKVTIPQIQACARLRISTSNGDAMLHVPLQPAAQALPQ